MMRLGQALKKSASIFLLVAIIATVPAAGVFAGTTNSDAVSISSMSKTTGMSETQLIQYQKQLQQDAVEAVKNGPEKLANARNQINKDFKSNATAAQKKYCKENNW